MATEAHLLARLLDQLARRINVACDDAGLPATQWALLRHIQASGRSARTMPAIANYFGEDEADARQLAAALVAKRLLTVVESAGRPAVVRITPEGERLLESDPLTRIEDAIQGIAPDMRSNLAAQLEHVYMALGLPATRPDASQSPLPSSQSDKGSE